MRRTSTGGCASSAGYEVHVYFSPVVVRDGWLANWAELLDQLDGAVGGGQGAARRQDHAGHAGDDDKCCGPARPHQRGLRRRSTNGSGADPRHRHPRDGIALPARRRLIRRPPGRQPPRPVVACAGPQPLGAARRGHRAGDDHRGCPCRKFGPGRSGACSYSRSTPPRRSRRWMARWVNWSGSVIGSGSGASGRALTRP
jgi:hypothetical protein